MPRQPVSVISPEKFAQSVIPKLIDGKEALRIFFSTYNTVTGYHGGAAETGDPKLEIVVAEGGAQPAGLAEIFASAERAVKAVAVGNFATADEELSLATQDARQGQEAVASTLSRQAARHGYPDVAVIYAGYSAFVSAIEMVKELRKQSPDTFIAVLTCDCGLEAKRWELGTIDGIDATIVTPYCGGHRDMRDLLEAFKAQWPNRILRV